MPTGGEINKDAIVESFQKVKDDIAKLSHEVEQIKSENGKLRLEYIDIKREISSAFSEKTIQKIVEKTISTMNKKPSFNERVIKKINRNKKIIIKNRIMELASSKNISLPEIKEIIVDSEQMCSKATFYRYIDRLRARNLISEIDFEDKKVLVKVE